MKMHNHHLIRGTVEDLSVGNAMASITVRSGKRLIHMLLTTGEAFRAGVELNRDIYCLIEGKSVTLFRDASEYFRLFSRNHQVLECSVSHE